MSPLFRENANFAPWGPFIPKNYVVTPITRRSVIIGSTIFAISGCFAISAIYLGVRQTRTFRRPWRSAYIWMIWLELLACVIISIICLLYFVTVIRPSFYFYMGLLILWAIQVQLLLQIIINRIRVILLDRRKGRFLMIGVAVIVTMIIISVFCIWIPARLQISERYMRINEVWDRIEKVIYLIIDAALNWYFIRVVKANLVLNGLQKYNKLVKFNQKIIVVSLLMDVMIIAAMSIPNGFIYALFHPLAYLVKLNIEMLMANLIKKIAIASSHNDDFIYEFATTSFSSDTPHPPTSTPSKRRSSFNPFAMLARNQIRKTEEYIVQSQPKSEIELQDESGSTHSCVVGTRRSGTSNKIGVDTDARSWYEGDDTNSRNRRSQDTRRSARASSQSGDTGLGGSGDEEAILVKSDPVFTKW